MTERPLTERHRVRGYEVIALLDASGSFPLSAREAFPDATSDDWERARAVDPDALGADGAWLLDFRCFAIRHLDGGVTMVDAGVGTEDSPAARWAPVPGRLPDVLELEGIRPAEVDTVVLTHLHVDHLGWSVLPTGVPMFPNARYVVQRAEIAALEEAGTEAVLDYAVRPLRRSDQLHDADGEVRLASGGRGEQLRLVPTPGHTPGHQSVLVEGAGEYVLVTGDVLVHAVQLVNPDVAYVYEDDQPLARRTRQSVLTDASTRGALLATSHLTRPFVRSERPRADRRTR